MFNAELKFTCDLLKKWFSSELKQVEINEDAKDLFSFKKIILTSVAYVIFLQILLREKDGFCTYVPESIYIWKTYMKKTTCLKWALTTLIFFKKRLKE